MGVLSAAAVLATAVLAAAAAPAQEPAGGAAATPLQGLTVAIPRTPPSIVATYPAAGATVRPGVMVLKVTFDQPMAADGWSYSRAAEADYPSCLARPRLLGDGRTFVLLCTTAPGRRYAVRLSDGAERGFVNIARRIAPAFELQFSTSQDSVWSLPDALKVAGLKDDEGPVETSEVAGR